MIRILINGKEIEIESNMGFSFMFENSIFSFSNFNLKRTQQFKIIRTLENDKLLGLAHRPDFSGEEVRVIHPATLYYSGGLIEGELMFIDIQGKHYNCIFVYGKVDVLQKIVDLSDLGDLRDFLTMENYKIIWGNTLATPNQTTKFGQAEYKSNVVRVTPLHLLPSFRNGWIMDRITAEQNITFDKGVFSNYLNNIFLKTNKVIGRDVIENPIIEVNASQQIFNLNNSTVLELIERDFKTHAGTTVRLFGVRAKEPCSFTFNKPPAASFGYYGFGGFLLFNQNNRYYGMTPAQIWNNIRTQGTSFRQVEVNLSMNTGDEMFIQPYMASRVYAENNPNAPNTWQYLSRWIQYEGIDETYNFNLYDFVSFTENASYLSELSAKDNLPDIKLIEYLKVLQNLCGAGIIFKDNTVEFFDYDFSQITPISLNDKLIQIKSVKRGFKNFGQNNIIKFNSLEYVNSPIVENYTLTNENIPDEETIYEIPFSETNKVDNYAYSEDLEWDGSQLSTLKPILDNTELMYDDGSTILRQIPFYNNIKLREIISNSTQVIATFRMYQFEFHQIHEKSTFLFQNKLFAVAAAKWQKNVAELTLILLD